MSRILGDEVMVRGQVLKYRVIENERELDKKLTYFGVSGKLDEDVIEKAVREYFMDYGKYPPEVLELKIKGFKRIWLPLEE